MYREQLSDKYIMALLHWIINAFLVYLCNTIHAIDAHSKTVSIKLTPTDTHRASYRSMHNIEHVIQSCALRPAA